MDSILNCCSNLLDSLPARELSLVPALILGVLFSFIILLLMYRRHYKISLYAAFIQMFKDIFIQIPTGDHAEFMKCENEDCVKCKKSEELKSLIVEAWKNKEKANKEEYLRITSAVKKLIKSEDPYKTVKNNGQNPELNENQKPTIFCMPLPGNSIWTDLDCFGIEKELLKINYTIILEEFRQIFNYFQNGNTEGWKLNRIPSGHWCIFPVIDQGLVNDGNCQKCPNTAALLGSFPSLMKNCIFGNACFSLLFPDSHIEPHYGPTNIRLRCHFGLQVPDGCWLEVDGRQMTWEEGESIVFDDSYQHSAYYAPNNSFETPRAILLLDFWHPSISSAEKIALLELLKPGAN